MSKNVVVVLNYPGVRELLQSAEAQNIVNQAAEAAAAKAEELSGGLPFDVSSGVGGSRAYASVKAGSVHAFHKARKDNIMEKAKRSVKV